ncbi:hypothetical protein NEMIN01_1636 [Nematocida minor]|uniref:uncharacterized protein n=1 Tax=Nematocida minor TaxID=1912983 RepID=UPI00221E8A94|nr:uncharacterized protein NEMIN01_1636 [Nematocida minor]KAI5191703.1 hypothetical protein NEMIN01_1636 [Nematocida minor]
MNLDILESLLKKRKETEKENKKIKCNEREESAGEQNKSAFEPFAYLDAIRQSKSTNLDNASDTPRNGSESEREKSNKDSRGSESNGDRNESSSEFNKSRVSRTSESTIKSSINTSINNHNSNYSFNDNNSTASTDNCINIENLSSILLSDDVSSEMCLGEIPTTPDMLQNITDDLVASRSMSNVHSQSTPLLYSKAASNKGGIVGYAGAINHMNDEPSYLSTQTPITSIEGKLNGFKENSIYTDYISIREIRNSKSLKMDGKVLGYITKDTASDTAGSIIITDGVDEIECAVCPSAIERYKLEKDSIVLIASPSVWRLSYTSNNCILNVVVENIVSVNK